MAQQLYSALNCAHAHGVIHGNLRPSNILFAENNFIKVTDFGFPAHSYSDADNWYRMKNATVSKGTDIYAAGVILFQLLSGVYPQESFFNWKNYWALRHIPRKLRAIVLLLTQQNPSKAYKNADAAMQALKDFYDQQNTRMAEKVYITKSKHPRS
jgi:serine/threonine-protein kinase